MYVQILSPLSNFLEKRDLCSEWKREAIQIEEKLAEKQKAKIVQAVQDRFALSEENNYPDDFEDPCSSESEVAPEVPKQRQRRLSYTLEEPSPVLLAYMERFGQTPVSQKDVSYFHQIILFRF